MSINQAHFHGGLILYQGEQIVNFSKNVTLAFDETSREAGPIFRGKYKGIIFVTTHRMIFLNKDQHEPLISFAVAFMYMRKLHVEQPLFGANYISGIAAAHPQGGFQGEVKFQLIYSSGGAIDASAALRKVNAIFHRQRAAPPSYAMAASNLYEPPPPSYQAAQGMNNVFAETNMFISPASAPYDGVYQRQPNGMPPPQYIPGYPNQTSTWNGSMPTGNQGSGAYPVQPVYHSNGSSNTMFVPQNHQYGTSDMPPSYEQSQNRLIEKSR